jgi:hypothetical protein
MRGLLERRTIRDGVGTSSSQSYRSGSRIGAECSPGVSYWARYESSIRPPDFEFCHGGDIPTHLYGVIQPRSHLDDGNSAGADCCLGVCLVCHPQLVAEPNPRDLISSTLILIATHGRRTRLHLLVRPHGTGGVKLLPHVSLLFKYSWPRGRWLPARSTRDIPPRRPEHSGGCFGTENVHFTPRLVVAGAIQDRFPDASTLVTAEDQLVS